MPFILQHKEQGNAYIERFTTQVEGVEESLGGAWLDEQGSITKINNRGRVRGIGDSWNVSKFLRFGSVTRGFVVYRFFNVSPKGFLAFHYDFAAGNGYSVIPATNSIEEWIGGSSSALTPASTDTGYDWLSGFPAMGIGFEVDGLLRVSYGGDVANYNDLTYREGFLHLIGGSSGAAGASNNEEITGIDFYSSSLIVIQGIPIDWYVRIRYTSSVGVTSYLEFTSTGDDLEIDVLPYFFLWNLLPFNLIEVFDDNDIVIYAYTNPVNPGDVLEFIDIQSLDFPRTDNNEGWREFQHEFITPDAGFNGLSATVRPDALALDGKTDFSLGPVSNGDPSLGLLYKLWRLQWRAGSFYLKDLVVGDEVLLTDYAPDVTELSLAFDQNGRANFTWSSGAFVYLYWFDPFLGNFTLDQISGGRTPRLVLDNPEDVTESSLILFYVNLLEDRVVYRQQDDRYATQFLTGLAGVQNLYIMRVRFTRNFRIQLLYALHWPLLGKWTLGVAASLLYTVPTGPDSVTQSHSIASASLVDFIIQYTSASDSIDALHEVVIAWLYEPLIQFTDQDYLDFDHLVVSGIITLVIIEHLLRELEYFDIDHSVVSAACPVVVITDETETEAYDITHSVVSATCAVP